MLCQLSEFDAHQVSQERIKKKKSTGNKQQNTTGAEKLSFLGSLLDILLLKKDISNR